MRRCGAERNAAREHEHRARIFENHHGTLFRRRLVEIERIGNAHQIRAERFDVLRELVRQHSESREAMSRMRVLSAATRGRMRPSGPYTLIEYTGYPFSSKIGAATPPAPSSRSPKVTETPLRFTSAKLARSSASVDGVPARSL